MEGELLPGPNISSVEQRESGSKPVMTVGGMKNPFSQIVHRL